MPTPRLKTLLYTLIFLLPGLTSDAQSWQWETDNNTFLYFSTVLDSHSSTISAAYAVLPDRLVLAKRDKYGNPVWARNIVSSSGMSVNSIQGGVVLDNWDNIYFISRPIASIDSASVNTPGPYALVKLNSNGRFLWARPLGDTATIPVTSITSSGDRIFMSVIYNAYTNLTYNGTTYPNPAGNSLCNLIAGLDTAGNALWTKRLYTQPNVISCGKREANTRISVNSNRELLLTGQSTDRLFLESTAVIDLGYTCTSFYFGMVLDGNTGDTKWVKQLPLDSLAARANTFTYDRHYLSAILPNGNALVYRNISNDTTYASSSGSTYSVELSNKLYQFDKSGNLIRKDSMGNLRDWYELFFIKAGDSSQFYSTGFYHNNTLPSSSVYEVRKWDTTVHNLWTKRVDYDLYFPYFDPSWGFDYRAKALALILQADLAGSDPYHLAYFGNDSLMPHGQLMLTRMVEGANFISGTTFFDLNKNGIRDGNEPVAPGVMIGSAVGDTIYTFSHRNGIYNFIVGPGSYTFKPFNLGALYPHYTIAAPALQTAVAAGYGSYIRNRNFALQANASITDGAISISYYNLPRPGNVLNTKAIIINTGTVNISGSYKIVFDSARLSFVKSDTGSTLTDARTLTIPLSSLPPFGVSANTISFALKTSAKAGDTLHISGQLLLSAADANPADNIDSSLVPVRSSYDPNDKQAYPFRDINYDSAVAGRQEIDYIIHFQNTGDDTAFTVQILDSLDKRLDASTFRLISSSHPVDIDWQKPRSLGFYFKDILLPDSGTNEPRSHGFVRFKIKPFPTVTTSDTIHNTAAIYFDYNSPVITGTALSNFLRKAIVTATNDITQASKYLSIRPNPTTGTLYFGLKREVYENMNLGIYDAAGKLVLSTGRLVVGGEEDGIDVSFLKAGVYFFMLQGRKDTYLKSFIRL